MRIISKAFPRHICMNPRVVQEAAAALRAGGSFQSLSCVWVAGEPQQQHGHPPGTSRRKLQGESNEPCKRNPALLCLAKRCKILDKPGQVALFLSNSVLRFQDPRHQPEWALCTLKCTSLEKTAPSAHLDSNSWYHSRQLCVTEVHIPCAEPSLLLRLLRRTAKPQHGSSHSLLQFTTPGCHHDLLPQLGQSSRRFLNSFKAK